MFSNVLIANRGEIAVRVARACRELGIRSIAVHSTADQGSEVLRLADETVQIGPAAARRSYLNPAAVISAALQTGAEAIHPGYGFLSEDPDFAEICEAYGITFIGPPAPLMRDLGDKARARALMARAGLPTLPGSDGPVQDEAAVEAVAAEVGFPLIVKAVAGGGGRGMAVVHDAAELLPVYRKTRAGAQLLFGDGRVYLERYLPTARHVEVQVLADAHGNVVHLGERDCSVQRRHQKLLEETPAPNLPAEVTGRMGEMAVRGVRALGYTGVGTFEFLVDEAGRFTFMEINGRIQVEHPVTEQVTGIDLVQEQIKAAAGVPLAIRQEDVRRTGVAMECRVNTEDPARDFTPTAGTLTDFRVPGGPFTRVDSHAYTGWRVPADYDSLLAKVVVWAPDRAGAVARMDRALAELVVSGPGVHTTADFLRAVLAEESFRAGRHTTSIVASMAAVGADGHRRPGG
ncbi:MULTISPECIES: acetyl-CoA carboxylase biotin carboxylase subunit [Streptomycetaceae]|uniref:biotin carboxylase n=1 Tax=Streptantibioticus cattleyicolor (strain ATCC 35852 / DSM 46488 / JCM 4925 / NBRC 14057 / NRRL 8057) TaxID=1003195 RepID=F8K0J2_STREN|nr:MULTISPECIES: acetyl-CoA carboxylase biotin carboxylase subunit [Streptomycetaceae]AEW97396.1 PdmP1 [Streptantibioticus cattleyicolor NRRL 8057 = DSM 46488]MYS61842.1 acetyl-CoA carboxylase biotin carboxylase subunit [Streptomyces sp. SID5468]CCB77720.1 acetyl-CoA carboxylase subunit (biotin carboxylase subunit) [Streptantibioticus cattleyicolor NRRL 8057 = DSM 46488]